MAELFTNFVDAWMNRLVVATLCAAVLSFVLAIVFRLRRPVPHWECWVWRICCVKLLLMAVLPVGIGVPLLPHSLSPKRTGDALASSHEKVDRNRSGVAVAELTDRSSEQHLVHPAGSENQSNRPAITNDSNADTRRNDLKTGQPVKPDPSAMWTTLKASAFVLWLLGVIVHLVRMAFDWNRARRLLATAKPIRHAGLIQFTYQHARQLGLHRPLRLMSIAEGCSPKLLGVQRPCILLSRRFLNGCSMGEVELVIGHELAHVARRDLLWKWAIAVTYALFFFHPSVWWMSRRILATQEMACDQMVISRLRARVGEYARLLLKVMMMPQVPRIDRVAEVGASGRVGTLEERLLAMKRFTVEQNTFKHLTWVVAATAAVLLLPWKLVASSTPTILYAPTSASETSEGRPQQVVRSLVPFAAGTVAFDRSGSAGQDDVVQSQTAQDGQRARSQSTRSTQSSGASVSSRSSSASNASGAAFSSGGTTGSESLDRSDVSKSVTYAEDGESVTIKQRGNKFTVERRFNENGEAKSEKFQFNSQDEFREKLPNEFKRFAKMTSPPPSGRGAGVVEVRGGVHDELNPAQAMLLENLRRLREENRENPQLRMLIEEMIEDLVGKTTGESDK